MPKLNNQSLTAQTSDTKGIEEGRWMYFSEATGATKRSEKTLKRYIKRGDLKCRRQGDKTNSPVQVWITPDFITSIRGELEQQIDDPDIFDADLPNVECESENDPQEFAGHVKETASEDNPYERLVKTMVSEFTVQLDRQREVVFELRKELQEKDSQLRLLPDLQKQLEEKEKLAHIQTLALEKQVLALQTNMRSQEKIVEELQIENNKRAEIAEELRHENVEQAKLAEELQSENEKQGKLTEELHQENERLRAEAEQLKTKRSWLGWFLGQKTVQ
jgi:DNA repair exonuclease SbcCD ATPase subunit